MSLPGPVVALCGATASGKTAVADAVALTLGTSVVSVDAMQVYRGMDIGTAKTPPAQRPVPLLMVDVVNPDESYSVERYQCDARACVDSLLDQGKVAVLCGGTGLYLNALIDEMDFPHGHDGDARRAALEQQAKAAGPEALYAELRSRDPESAEQIHPNNVRRVIRALELCDQGLSYASQKEALHKRTPHYDARLWAIDLPRDQLYQRIDQRVDLMFERGLVDEVLGLAAKGLASTHTARQAIGYKEILDALGGSITMDEARQLTKARTRRYAKRQLSWFRHDSRVRWLDGTHTVAQLAAQVVGEVRP